jgi:hypothetical protein
MIIIAEGDGSIKIIINFKSIKNFNGFRRFCRKILKERRGFFLDGFDM